MFVPWSQTFTQPTYNYSYVTHWIYLQTARRLLTPLNLIRTVNFYFVRFSRLNQTDIWRNHVYDQCTQPDNSNKQNKIKRNQICSYHSSHMFKKKKGPEMAPYVIARLAFRGSSVSQIMDRVAECECEIKY